MPKQHLFSHSDLQSTQWQLCPRGVRQWPLASKGTVDALLRSHLENQLQDDSHWSFATSPQPSAQLPLCPGPATKAACRLQAWEPSGAWRPGHWAVCTEQAGALSPTSSPAMLPSCYVVISFLPSRYSLKQNFQQCWFVFKLLAWMIHQCLPTANTKINLHYQNEALCWELWRDGKYRSGFCKSGLLGPFLKPRQQSSQFSVSRTLPVDTVRNGLHASKSVMHLAEGKNTWLFLLFLSCKHCQEGVINIHPSFII